MSFEGFRTPRSLRARLTVWHGLALGLVLIAFTAGVYGLLSRGLLAETDRSLAERSEQVNRAIPPDLALLPDARIIVPPPETFASADTVVQIANLDGRVLATSQNLGRGKLPIRADVLGAVRTGQDRYEDAEFAGMRVRLYSAPIIANGEPVGMVQVARSLESVERALSQLRVFAGTGLVAALALSGLIVWIATDAALRPLDQLTDTAEAIGSSRDLRRRVSVPDSGDEVERLATTFNHMLCQLEASDGELRGAYAQVQEAYKKLELALEAERRLVADASHELRTPLTTIRGNASMLRQFAEATPEDREAALAQIGQQADRMSRLVSDLLTLARSDAGQPLERVRVTLRPLVEEAVAQVRPFAGQQIELEAHELPEVTGDPDSLRRLILILLENAVKYTPTNGQIRVQLWTDGDEVRVAISDTGSGIAPEDLPHIFERFYRADRGRKAGGTGLGLSIARSIVEQHEGKIEVYSAQGSGSTFSVRLPTGSNFTSSEDQHSAAAPQILC